MRAKPMSRSVRATRAATSALAARKSRSGGVSGLTTARSMPHASIDRRRSSTVCRGP